MDFKQVKTETDMFPIAFQSWHNGSVQTSSVHYSNRFYQNGESEFSAFVDKHERSNTFATLHICNSVEEWDEVYRYLFGDEGEDE